MNIAAYTICKNESRHVEAYMDSLDALGVWAFILDTGSTDDTVEKLKARGAHVVSEPYESWSSPEEYKALISEGKKPFRFDTARNRALELVPEEVDLLISLDLDETITPAFAQVKKLKDVSRVLYLQHNDQGEQSVNIPQDRIHARHSYHWKYIAHETVLCDAGMNAEKRAFIQDVLIIHKPDLTRPHSYEHMLRIGVEEHPGDMRMSTMLSIDMHRQAVWFMKNQRMVEAYHQFGKFLKLETTGPFDQSYAWAMMARCYKGVGDIEIDCLLKAVKAFPRRESIVDLAQAYLDRKWYEDAKEAAHRAIEVTEGQDMHDSDLGAWTYRPYEIAARSAKALEDDPRLIEFIVEKGIEECKGFENFEQAKTILEGIL